MTITEVRKRIEHEYRKSKKLLMNREMQHHLAPTSELKTEIDQLNGMMKAFMKTLGFVEKYQNGTQLFQEGA